LLLICSVSIALADKRVALVIGNSAYRNAPALVNPRNDAQDIGKSLRDLGFSTIVATDLDRGGMNDALDRFSRTVGGAEIALVYYSGHGMQFAGKNFLLPVEARLENAEDVNRFRLMPVDDVFDVLQGAPGARIVILDACRNNPVEDDLKRRLASIPGANRDAFLTRGFSRVAANGLIVAYATQANDVASDGTGRNSPFASALLHHVGTPDLDLRQMLFKVQDEVDRLTGGKQRPELSISLVGEYKLKPATGAPANQEVPAAPQVAALPPSSSQTPVSTSAALPASDVRRFDGLWLMNFTCVGGTASGAPLVFKAFTRIENGVIRGKFGVEDTPGSEAYEGAIHADGVLLATVDGVLNLGMKCPGCKFHTSMAGRLEGSQGTAIRSNGACDVKFEKQLAGAGPTVATLPTESEVQRASTAGATSNVRRFDGTWLVTQVCPPTKDGVKGSTVQFTAEIKEGSRPAACVWPAGISHLRWKDRTGWHCRDQRQSFFWRFRNCGR
jgi:uncharacterized caspase-like protein